MRHGRTAGNWSAKSISIKGQAVDPAGVRKRPSTWSACVCSVRLQGTAGPTAAWSARRSRSSRQSHLGVPRPKGGATGNSAPSRAGNDGRRPERLEVASRTDNSSWNAAEHPVPLLGSSSGVKPWSGSQGTEPPVAKPDPESPNLAEQLHGTSCASSLRNCVEGSGPVPVDGATCRWTTWEHGQAFGLNLDGTYQPQPVKSSSTQAGRRQKLGVPCVVDRLVQQAVLQVLQTQWDPTFSEHRRVPSGALGIRRWPRHKRIFRGLRHRG